MNLLASICEVLRGSNRPRCSRCKSPIRKTHRFQVVHHRFLWFRWETREHRDCNQPHMDPSIRHGAFCVLPGAMQEPKFEVRPIPGREFCNLFGPSAEEIARSIYEDGK